MQNNAYRDILRPYLSGDVLFITDIKISRVPDNVRDFQFYHAKKLPMAEFWSSDPARIETVCFDVEHIKARCFRKGFLFQPFKEQYIGWTKNVEDVLGMPMEAFDTLSKERNSIRDQYQKINKQSFWIRLKYLFTGKLNIK